MKRLLTVLVLMLATAGTAAAQGLAVRPYVGTYAPMLPLAALGTQANDVELDASPAAGLEVGYMVIEGIELYMGAAAAFTRMNHSSVMELERVDGTASSRVNLLVPSAGVILTPMVGLGLRPLLRLGAGAKVYDTDLFYVRETIVDFAGDVGIGLSASAGAVRVTAEARWLPSSFAPANLPIRQIGNEGQWQNDWLFQMGVAFQP